MDNLVNSENRDEMTHTPPHTSTTLIRPFNPTKMIMGCVRSNIVPVFSPMLHSLLFDMQHDHIQKKCFDPLSGSRVCVRVKILLRVVV